MNEEIKLFKCEVNNCKLMIQACIKRQFLAKNKLRINPAISSSSIADYSNCLNCNQGIEIKESNQELYKTIIKEFVDSNPNFSKKRGRPIKTKYKCGTCKTEKEDEFKKGRYTTCNKCRSEYQKQYMKEYYNKDKNK